LRSDHAPPTPPDSARAALPLDAPDESPRAVISVAAPDALAPDAPAAPGLQARLLHQLDRWLTLARRLPKRAQWGIAASSAVVLVAGAWLLLRAPRGKHDAAAPSSLAAPETPPAASDVPRPAAAPAPVPAAAPPTAETSAPAESDEPPARKHALHHRKKPAAKAKSAKRTKSTGAR
jgi:hypothetical protein